MKTARRCDVGYRTSGLLHQQSRRPLQTQPADKPVDGLTDQRSKDTMKMEWREMSHLRHLLQAQVIRQVLFDVVYGCIDSLYVHGSVRVGIDRQRRLRSEDTEPEPGTIYPGRHKPGRTAIGFCAGRRSG